MGSRRGYKSESIMDLRADGGVFRCIPNSVRYYDGQVVISPHILGLGIHQAT